MHIKIYSLAHCKDCIEYHSLIDEFCKQKELSYEIIDLDLEQHVKEIIRYRLTFIPSTIFFSDNDDVLVNKGGIFTLNELNQFYEDATRRRL